MINDIEEAIKDIESDFKKLLKRLSILKQHLLSYNSYTIQNSPKIINSL